MCNGDLGMYRVMPWAYPTIPGQSSGGTSVDPTPTPEPEPTPVDPYDFSKATFRIKSRTEYIETSNGMTYCRFYLIVSGIVTVDTSRVSSVLLKTNNLSALTFNAPGTFSKRAVDNYANDIADINSGNWGWVLDYKSSASGKATMSGTPNITMTVYDSTGAVIQEFTTDVSG